MQINFIQLIWGTSNFKKAHSFSYSVPGGHTHVFFQMDPCYSIVSFFKFHRNGGSTPLQLKQTMGNYSNRDYNNIIRSTPLVPVDIFRVAVV